MEAILTAIKVQLDAQSEKLDVMGERLQKLQEENAVLRKEIFGTGASSPSNPECDGLIEIKTLREAVDEINFEVKALTSKLASGYACNKDGSSAKEFPAVAIRSKTIEDERNWMRERFNEVSHQRSVIAGASMEETTIDNISWAIPFSDSVRATCAIKMSNYLNSSLTDPQYKTWGKAREREGPSRVAGQTSEAICFEGVTECDLLYSFKVTSCLRLTIYFWNLPESGIQLGIGFTPEGLSTDLALWKEMKANRLMPDVVMTTEQWCRIPLEVFVNHGKLLARAHLTPGPRSVAHVEIMEIGPEVDTKTLSIPSNMKPLIDGAHTSAYLTTDRLLINSSLVKVACTIEIANCLNVNLQNSSFYCKCPLNNFMPSEIIPFRRETFSALDNTSVEAIFSYDIESTDLRFVLALQAEPNNSYFSAAFLPLPGKADITEEGFGSVINPKEWETHLYMKSAGAKDGEQVIQTRNIRACISITEEEKSVLKIRIFAV